MSERKFVHLHLHTDYSLLDAANQIKPLSKRVADLGMSACAITDHGNMYGAISFYQNMKAQGVKPIIGCEVYYTRGSRHERAPRSSLGAGEKVNHHLILLAENLEGYHNLVRLTSKAYTEGFYYKPRIDRELLAQHSTGLIGLSACLSGVPNSLLARDKFGEAAQEALQFREILGKDNYFLEIQDHGLEMQRRILEPLRDLSQKTGIPLVATNDAHYLMPEDWRAHDVLLCIGSGKTVNDPNRLRYGSDQFYVKTAEEMWQLFGGFAPEALTRTLEIAERCEFELPTGTNFVPNFPVPEQGLSLEEYFEKVVREGYEDRRAAVWQPFRERGELRHPLSEYQQRASNEIAMIKQMGFASYFLIVWDIVRYARQNNVPVGPGRGSAAGSLVAYCLGITDVDPLQYDLLFERFLNPERVSMPDIDIDFCVRGRESVIRHVTELYGRESVCQIITFGTMASRAAIKDVGRALDIPYAEVERVAKLIPPPVRGRNVSIDQALQSVPELTQLIEGNPKYAELIDLAKRLEGCARHSSVHAAGVVISPEPLPELVPIAVSSRNELTTQYAMSDLEKTGMLKMDFLALTALTVINDCLLSIKQMLNTEIDWSALSFDDELTMKLFADGRTEAVFQFESSGMQEICRRLKPKGLEDLAALNALYRPGPLDGGMVDEYIARHHGTRTVRYIIPQMRDILNNTYGILVYQEQIMQLAQQLAGYSLGEADLMRRAMGKKKREEMAQQQEKFIKGAVERNIKEEKAEQIFNLMAQFADYGFNRSHSVAYAYLAFQTAYLKAHYPEHFYAAVLSHEVEDASKVLKYANELRGYGIKLLPPDINESLAEFTPLKGAIRFGLSAIKGMGRASVEAIISARDGAAFKSLPDLVERVHARALNKRVLEGLNCSGCLDSLDGESVGAHKFRARLSHSLDQIMGHGARQNRERESGQDNLFGGAMQAGTSNVFGLADCEPWSHAVLLAAEKSALGFYLAGHPLEAFLPLLQEIGCEDCESVATLTHGERVRLGGVVTGLQVKTTKKGDQFGIFRLEDHLGNIKCLVWSEAYAKLKNVLKPDASVLILGKIEAGESAASVVVEEIEILEELQQKRARMLVVRLPKKLPDAAFEELFSVMNRHQGQCEVYLEMPLSEELMVRVRPHGGLRVRGSLALESDLRTHGCQVQWLRTPIYH